MIYQPTLRTNRLILRPFSIEDAKRVRDLAGNIEVARYTEAIPHPYGDEVAESWIEAHDNEFREGKSVNFAITLKESGEILGAVGLIMEKKDQKANLGYWIGRPYWGCGYCSEAAKALVEYGFHQWSIHRIYARHMECNPASGHVMRNVGMHFEGELKDDMYRDGKFHTMLMYGIINSKEVSEGDAAY